MRRKLLRLLNVRPHETKLVQRLFWVQFFLVLGASFLFVTANAVFLPLYTTRELPRAFFISGLALLGANVIYGKAERSLPVRRQLVVMISGLAICTFLIWVSFFIGHNRISGYILFVWNNIVFLLSSLLFWGLAALLFDVRESRRIFTIIGAGEIPARLLGFLAVSVVAPYIGLQFMILISVISFLISILCLRSFFIRFPHYQVVHQGGKEGGDSRQEKGKDFLRKFFGSDLIISISILSLLTFAALILIDFSFLSELAIKYHTGLDLASFLGVFFAEATGLAFLLKLFFTSRLIDRLGMVWSLLLSPLLLLAFSVVILLNAPSKQFSGRFLYILGFMAVLTEILKAIIQEPVFLVLFQPLKPSLRVRGHYIAKGYMLPLAFLTIGGILLIHFHFIPRFSIPFFFYLLMFFLLAWALSVFIVKRKYLSTLHRTLQSGLFRGHELLLKDRNIQELMVQKLESPLEPEALYALELLVQSGYGDLNRIRRDYLHSPHRLVQVYILDSLKTVPDRDAVPDIETLLERTEDQEIRARCLDVLSLLDPDFSDKASRWLNSPDPGCREAVLGGLLRSEDLNALLLGGQQLLDLIQSPEASSRILGARILGSAGKSQFYKTLRKLISDPQTSVRLEAIRAAGMIRAIPLLEDLIACLDQHALKQECLRTLAVYGDPVLDHFHSVLSGGLPERARDLVLLAARMPGPGAGDFLLRLLDAYPSEESRIINALWEREFEAAPQDRVSWLIRIRSHLEEAAFTLDLQRQLRAQPEASQLLRALHGETERRIERVLKIFSFLFDRPKVNEAIFVFGLEDPGKLSNALEMLEIMMPRRIFTRFHQLTERFFQGDPGENTREDGVQLGSSLRSIIQNSPFRFNDWTRSMAMTFIRTWKQPALLEFLGTLPERGLSPILLETKAFVISGNS